MVYSPDSKSRGADYVNAKKGLHVRLLTKRLYRWFTERIGRPPCDDRKRWMIKGRLVLGGKQRLPN
jgi:hypothetical protein